MFEFKNEILIDLIQGDIKKQLQGRFYSVGETKSFTDQQKQRSKLFCHILSYFLDRTVLVIEWLDKFKISSTK